MPAATLAHDAPIYDPAMERPAYLDEVQAFDPIAGSSTPGEGADFGEMLLGLLASPNICSRHWIWEQYDHQVMVNTVVLPGCDAAVLRIGDTGRGEMTTRASRSRATATAATATSTRTWARRSRSPRPRATSPAPAASRRRSPTA